MRHLVARVILLLVLPVVVAAGVVALSGALGSGAAVVAAGPEGSDNFDNTPWDG
jgi:hypothetical protein